MKKIITYIVIFFFLCCKTRNRHIADDWKIPIVYDTLPKSDKYFETRIIRKPINQLIYIGVKNDSILIAKNSLNINSYYSESLKNKDTLDIKEVEIIPDLNQDLSIDLENFAFPPSPILFDEHKTDSIFEIWKKRPRNYVKAYPIFIKNITRDTVHIDNQDGDIFLIQEAKNKEGEWKPIEYWRYSTCGNSYGTTSIGQNDILIIKKTKYRGLFKTQMRLKLKTNNKIIYSKPFDGSINVEQFDTNNIDSWTKKRYENIDFIFFNK